MCDVARFYSRKNEQLYFINHGSGLSRLLLNLNGWVNAQQTGGLSMKQFYVYEDASKLPRRHFNTHGCKWEELMGWRCNQGGRNVRRIFYAMNEHFTGCSYWSKK